jgi:hypothetical protein
VPIGGNAETTDLWMLGHVELKGLPALKCRERRHVRDERMITHKPDRHVVGDNLRNSIEPNVANALGQLRSARAFTGNTRVGLVLIRTQGISVVGDEPFDRSFKVMRRLMSERTTRSAHRRDIPDLVVAKPARERRGRDRLACASSSQRALPMISSGASSAAKDQQVENSLTGD